MAKINLKNVWAFLQGNLRYKLYYSPFRFLIRQHIIEQIEVRFTSMKSVCLFEGSCEECGCKTTQLQMATKPCEGNCYPRLVNKKIWIKFKTCKFVKLDNQVWRLRRGKFKLLTQKKYNELLEK